EDNKILNITATVDAGTAGTTITNTTGVGAGDQNDPSTTGDSLSAAITVLQNIDLVTTKTVNNASPSEGDTVVYTIRVENPSLVDATNVSLTDVLPTGVTYVSDDASGAYVSSTGVWTVGSVLWEDNKILNITATVDAGTAGTTITNTTGVGAGDQNDPSTTGDSLSASITVTNADLVTVLAVDNATPNEGDSIVYSIVITNNGPSDATNVSLTDVLPAGVTYVSDDASGAYVSSTGVWTAGSLSAGSSITLNITAMVNAGTDGTTITNTTTLALGDQKDLTALGDVLTVAISPLAIVDLSLTSTIVTNATQISAGDEIVFEIVVRNDGFSEATGVAVTDLIQSGFSFVSATVTQGTYDEMSGIWNIGSILSGGSTTLRITVSVLGIGDWSNDAAVTAADQQDIDSIVNNNNNSEDDQQQLTISPVVSLNIVNGFTPNGDGINDVFDVKYLEILYPNFKMEIRNRWGNVVYRYQHNGNPNQTPQWWDGTSNVGYNGNGVLPTGTYFYTIYFNSSSRKPKTSWVYLRR
ncbi:MAG: gliding motility-associated C-terminal domain-containing protein, partial [Flavobacteriaceae bacterium]|nr:gliding motility-associated C-terminal domain-containing protein [Flavobacteriaceae bacterium]